MITITKTLDKSIDTSKWLGLPAEDCFFFDIETTGFAAHNSQLYLIGACFYENNTWNFIQWFADTFSSEEDILNAFFEKITHFKYIVSFNGDGFDIPYLTKKAMSFGIQDTFDKVGSIDIFKAVKTFKAFLKTENCKQKSIEAFLGIQRDDKYNGGELIEVYRHYLRTGDDESKKLLLLHNAEDITGMPDILPILAYGRLTDTSVCGINVPDAVISRIECDETEQEVIFSLTSDVAFPKPLKQSTRSRYVSVKDSDIQLRVRLFSGELKYFYPNYKDYYYLPVEDKAIHKSVAEYVDKAYRKKASAANCYTRKTGLFLPQAATGIDPVMMPEYKSSEKYFPCDEKFLSDTEALNRYALEIIAGLIK